MASRRRSRAEWERLIAEVERRGERPQDAARRLHVALRTLQLWCDRLRRGGSASAPPLEVGSSPAGFRLVEVEPWIAAETAATAAGGEAVPGLGCEPPVATEGEPEPPTGTTPPETRRLTLVLPVGLRLDLTVGDDVVYVARLVHALMQLAVDDPASVLAGN